MDDIIIKLMNKAEIMVNKLEANYSSNCHFKIKIVVSTSANKESVENKHSFKYEKGKSEVNINEKLELILYLCPIIFYQMHLFI